MSLQWHKLPRTVYTEEGEQYCTSLGFGDSVASRLTAISAYLSCEPSTAAAQDHASWSDKETNWSSNLLKEVLLRHINLTIPNDINV